jgi:hypothetical protein
VASNGEAQLLAQQGFATLAIGYYRLPGQPETIAKGAARNHHPRA